MNPNEKSRSGNFGSKTDLNGNPRQTFSVLDSTTDLGTIYELTEGVVKPRKVIRCYPCHSCHRGFAPERLIGDLILCRDCVASTRGKGAIARRNQLDRIVNSVSKRLRARLEAR